MIKKLDFFIYVSILLPFVQPVINFDSDLSPVFISLIFIRLIFTLRTLKFDKKLVSFVLYSFVLFIILISFGLTFIKAIAPFLVSLMLLFFKNSTLNKKSIKYALIIYIFFVLLWILNKDIAIQIQSFIVRKINGDGVIGTRGYPILSTEAGLFGGLMIMITEIYVRYYKDYEYFQFITLFLLAVSFLSFSASAVFYLVIFLIYRHIFKINFIRAFYFIIFILFILPFIASFENRFSFFLFTILNLDYITIINDSSFGHRMIALFIGLIFLFKQPIPQENTIEYANIYFNDYLSGLFKYTTELHWVSSIGLYLAYGGIFSLIWFWLLYRTLPHKKNVIYLILTLCFSYSLLFPLGYLIVYTKSFLNNVNQNEN